MSLDALVDFTRAEVESGRLPSASIAVGRDGELILDETFGAPAGTRYLSWSCSKGVVVGAFWLLVGEGKIAYEDKVADHIPEFATNGKDAVTVEQLLTMTAGFPQAPLGPPRWNTREGRLEAFGRWRLNWEPGTRYEYHPTQAHWVLAELIERQSGQEFRSFIHERVCAPLGMRWRLGVPLDEQDDIAKLEVVGVTSTPEEHEAAGLFPPVPSTTPPGAALLMNSPDILALGIPAGGAVATAADYARYYQALLHNPGGMWDADVLADGTTRIRSTLPDPLRAGIPSNRSAGLVIRGDHEHAWWMMRLGRTTSPRTFGHDGAGGQTAWADPDSGISFAFLSNGAEANRVTEEVRGTILTDLAALA